MDMCEYTEHVDLLQIHIDFGNAGDFGVVSAHNHKTNLLKLRNIENDLNLKFRVHTSIATDVHSRSKIVTWMWDYEHFDNTHWRRDDTLCSEEKTARNKIYLDVNSSYNTP